MKVNLIVGGLNIFCWLVWFLFNWSAGPHVRCQFVFHVFRIRIRMFLDLLDPHSNLFVRIRIFPSISKKIKKTLISTVLCIEKFFKIAKFGSYLTLIFGVANIPDHFSYSLETVFRVKILKFKAGIRGGKN
jgi:hypothetical protein